MSATAAFNSENIVQQLDLLFMGEYILGLIGHLHKATVVNLTTVSSSSLLLEHMIFADSQLDI